MSNLLLVSDLHLTDNPQDEYRWIVFPQLAGLCEEFKVKTIFFLGDVWDRKDRHSGTLLNRTVAELSWLQDITSASIYVLMGNHDEPVNGVPYWSFLDALNSIHYVTEPFLHPDLNIWLLPFSSNPVEAWKDLPLRQARALFLHQTVEGALIENDRKIEKVPHPMPILPRGALVYSGDVHRPQTVGGVTYVGTPYPTRFGETWPGRVLILDEELRYREVALQNLRKVIIDCDSPEQFHRKLLQGEAAKDDQVRVRCQLDQETITSWTEMELGIRNIAKTFELNLLSVEATFVQVMPKAEDTSITQTENVEQLPPAEILNLFAKDEGLSEEVVDVGQDLIRLALGGQK